jgi:hypothetical protein
MTTMTEHELNDLRVEWERAYQAKRNAMATLRPQGCICLPTSEKTCQNPICPRKALAKAEAAP